MDERKRSSLAGRRRSTGARPTFQSVPVRPDNLGSERYQMKPHATGHAETQTHYTRLVLMLVLSLLSMYALMYAMVNTFANVYMNVNQFYMAGLMAAPMGLIELALMGAMYRDKTLNTIVAAAASSPWRCSGC